MKVNLCNLTSLLIIINSFIVNNCYPTANTWKLNIVHTNDMHARFEETSARSTKCPTNGKCYGGFARIATLIREARDSSIPSIFLNAGDTYQGTTWFSVHKWKIVARFLNLLRPDVISLGNHEFDNGPEGLVPFINNASFDIVTSNLDLTDEPDLLNSKLKKSVVIEVEGHRIGIIGYLTPETKVIAIPGRVKFLDEVDSIKKEVEKLQQDGVKILIALGHSGYATDQKIAREVDGIDLVIGGHTNTFLYSGDQPDLEIPEGLYPTEIVQKSGRKVYVVQAYAYTKYLGNLTIDFDDDGEIQKILGNPILVDDSIKPAIDILDELEIWRPAVLNLSFTPVGSSKVLLDGDSKHCRAVECNLGNLITDAMIDYNVREYAGTDGWTDAAVAFHNGGTIRTSIDRSVDNNITMSDVLAVLPFDNVMGKTEVTGEQLVMIMEHGVRTLQSNYTGDLSGAFLQFSGLQVTFDLSAPSGSRVVKESVRIRCSKCRVPQYHQLNLKQNYTVLVLDFLKNGGDGFAMMENLTWHSSGVTTDQVLIEYLKRKSPVHPGVEWRIKFTDPKGSSANKLNTSVILIFFVILNLFSNI